MVLDANSDWLRCCSLQSPMGRDFIDGDHDFLFTVDGSAVEHGHVDVAVLHAIHAASDVLRVCQDSVRPEGVGV